MEQSKQSNDWTAEILLVVAVVAWILYEVYGRSAIDWINTWWSYIRMALGTIVIVYIWYYVKDSPEAMTTTMDFAKQIIKDGAAGGKEKRNVTNLMKKKVAATQQWRCGTCKTTLDETFQVDHVIALFNGGSNDERNLVALCPNCHAKKTMAERLDAKT